MEEKNYTVADVIDITIQKLGAIQLPISLYDSVGLPIRQSIGNLQVCLQTINSNIMPPVKPEDDRTLLENTEPEEVNEDVRNADPE